MSDSVCSVIFESGVVEHVGAVAVGIASPSLSVQKLFLLPVYSPLFCVTDVGRCRPMSDNVGGVESMSGVVKNGVG